MAYHSTDNKAQLLPSACKARHAFASATSLSSAPITCLLPIPRRHLLRRPHWAPHHLLHPITCSKSFSAPIIIWNDPLHSLVSATLYSKGSSKKVGILSFSHCTSNSGEYVGDTAGVGGQVVEEGESLPSSPIFYHEVIILEGNHKTGWSIDQWIDRTIYLSTIYHLSKLSSTPKLGLKLTD